MEISTMTAKLPISKDKIKISVESLALEIFNYFKEMGVDSIYMIIVLIGAFMFASDLLRELSKLGLKIETDIISVKSYEGINSGEIKISENTFLRKNLNGKHILIIDDILDTGKTLNKIRHTVLKHFNPKTIEFCCLLRKEIPDRIMEFPVRFIGFDIPNQFVIGYGLDFNGKYRELPFITDISLSSDEEIFKFPKNLNV